MNCSRQNAGRPEDHLSQSGPMDWETMKNREYREHANRHLERPALARGSARDHLRGPGGIEGESETQSNFQGRRGSGKNICAEKSRWWFSFDRCSWYCCCCCCRRCCCSFCCKVCSPCWCWCGLTTHCCGKGCSCSCWRWCFRCWCLMCWWWSDGVAVAVVGERRYDETLCLPNTELWNLTFLTKKEEHEHTKNVKNFPFSALLRKNLIWSLHRIP